MALLSKVHYRPLEAAIRWSGLARREHYILEKLGGRAPRQTDFPEWPVLWLNTQRIYDAIVNRELPCALKGIAVRDVPPVDDPDVTIRHVDLKAWMERYYPEQRPQFLFSWAERSAHPTITADSVRILIFERDSLRTQLQQKEQELQALKRQLGGAFPKNVQPPQSAAGEIELSARSETAYLHIIGALLHTVLGRSPSGKPYSSFANQEAVISVMIANYGGRLGITERTLRAKFASAKRRLASMP